MHLIFTHVYNIVLGAAAHVGSVLGARSVHAARGTDQPRQQLCWVPPLC